MKILIINVIVYKNESYLYIINSKWIRLWTEYVNSESDNKIDSKSFQHSLFVIAFYIRSFVK